MFQEDLERGKPTQFEPGPEDFEGFRKFVETNPGLFENRADVKGVTGAAPVAPAAPAEPKPTA